MHTVLARGPRVSLALAVVLWVGVPGAGADEDAELLRTLTVVDGLSHNAVYDLVQDARGFVWLATEGGVDRYDGYEFSPLADHVAPTELAEGLDVSCLVEDRAGRLWICTWGSGLLHFDPSTGALDQLRHDPDDPTSLSDNRVETVFEDRGGRIWAGTFRGLNQLEQDGRTFRRFGRDGERGSLSHDRVWAIAQDSAGWLWVGTEEGLDRIDPRSRVAEAIAIGTDHEEPGASRRVRTLLCDRHGNLWVGTQHGLARIDPARTVVTGRWRASGDPRRRLADDTVNVLFEDSHGNLWIGTQRGGLHRLDPASGVITRFGEADGGDSPLAHDVRALREDRSGILWVGTRGRGIALLDLKPPKFQLLRDTGGPGGAALSTVVHAVVVDASGRLWAGTDNGLLRYDRTELDPVRYLHAGDDPSSLANDSVEALAVGEDGSLWVGTSGGLDRLRPGATAFEHLRHRADDPTSLSSDLIQALWVRRDGSLWVGTREGLNRLGEDGRSFERHLADPSDPGALADGFVRAILEGYDGTLWVGTEVGGLARLRPGATRFERFQRRLNDPTSISSDRILSLWEGADGTLWIGTTHGLNAFDPIGDRFLRWGRDHGLPSWSVCGILGDRAGRLWLSTTRGLCRFDPHTGTIRQYTTADGLQGPIFSRGAAFAARDGRLFFGGLDGLNFFIPETVRDNPKAPPVVLTGFSVFSAPRSLGVPLHAVREIALRPLDSTFSFEFAALDFSSPEHNQFAYMLEGVDRDWNLAGARRQVTYSHVQPGDYVFRVRASNSDGVWNEEGLSIAVHMPPPFWQTRQFRLLLAALALGGAMVAVTTRLAIVRQRESRLRDLVAQRTAELASANDRLQRLADSDGLTGIANHRRFYELLYAEWRRALRSGQPLAVAMVDIDFFKAYNDALGHQLGDACLQQVASAIAGTPGRTGDVVARYGGEEFAVLLIATDAAGGLRVAEAIRATIEALGIPHPASPVAAVVTASVGVAATAPSEVGSPSQLVREADVALYRAKQQGRNRIHG